MKGLGQREVGRGCREEEPRRTDQIKTMPRYCAVSLGPTVPGRVGLGWALNRRHHARNAPLPTPLPPPAPWRRDHQYSLAVHVGARCMPIASMLLSTVYLHAAARRSGGVVGRVLE